MSEMKFEKDDFELLPEQEKNVFALKYESRTYFQDAKHRFAQNPLAMLGLILLVVIVVMAIFVPLFSPFTYEMQDLTARNLLPNTTHWLGTDKMGRDILVRVMIGCRISLSVGVVAAFINLCLGVTIGGICGYFGGKLDMLVMRIADCLYAIPSELYVILIMLLLPNQKIIAILLGISISGWIGMSRQVRAQIQSLKQQEFSLAAFVLGASKKRILFKHLIVNCMGPIIVSCTMMVPGAIFTEAFLSFIGIGISAPMASLGSLASEARGLLQTYPIQVVWPVLTLCLIILSLNFVGDGLGEALDPKKK